MNNRMSQTLVLVVVSLMLTGCPTAQTRAAKRALAAIPTTASIATLYTTTITAPAGMTITAATPPWLTFAPATGVLSGTPDGHDFGAHTVTLTAASGGKSGSSALVITVANPTFAAQGTIAVPMLSTSSPLTVRLSPAPLTAYTGTLTKSITAGGPTDIRVMGNGAPGTFTTDASGDFDLTVYWASGADFHADIFINLTSSNGSTLRLGPIKAQSQ